jgi:hypothetical protein
VILKSKANVLAACIAERAMPLPLWKWLDGGLSRLTFQSPCERKGVLTALNRCV